MKRGNSGGGKAPDFWRAFEEGTDRVIGDKPANTANDREPSEKALRQSEGEKAAQALPGTGRFSDLSASASPPIALT